MQRWMIHLKVVAKRKDDVDDVIVIKVKFAFLLGADLRGAKSICFRTFF
jgi:hypothetical protein